MRTRSLADKLWLAQLDLRYLLDSHASGLSAAAAQPATGFELVNLGPIPLRKLQDRWVQASQQAPDGSELQQQAIRNVLSCDRLIKLAPDRPMLPQDRPEEYLAEGQTAFFRAGNRLHESTVANVSGGIATLVATGRRPELPINSIDLVSDYDLYWLCLIHWREPETEFVRNYCKAGGDPQYAVNELYSVITEYVRTHRLLVMRTSLLDRWLRLSKRRL
ncbi:MAG TPA: hypothetical protein VLF59_05215 [Candidatus Saccharimonadales bacterium]|nr:hypothetical protein [Candidatus Saccharimonadales bacterium]